MAEPTPALHKYRGNCHCGANIFEIEVPEIKEATACNCSICSKKGYLWVFPGESFKVVKGDETTLTSYTFNSGHYKHCFCKTCGTGLRAENDTFPPEMRTAVNVHSLQGMNTWELKVNTYDGKAVGPEYEVPTYHGPEPTVEIENGKIYKGSCHCGAVKTCMKIRNLDSNETYGERVLVCNCSICERGAYIWIYPKRNQVVIDGRENLTWYAFRTRVFSKGFCKVCGVHILNDLTETTEEEFAALSPESQKFARDMGDWRPITLRMFNDFDWTKLETKQSDGINYGDIPYVNP